MPTTHFETVLYGFLMLQILLIKLCGGTNWEVALSASAMNPR
ncbi:uncharacterized protein METZ01_LOCUS388088 [marine metagenome]|uniref:Uncharacterized protein n=1 Tax=marine metagenome TaxID=408172 RepID=A0A382ULU1_9ZZZZ